MGQALTLRDLEDFDPGGGRGSRERRFCCPLCHGDRRMDAAHRSLSLNTETGAWHCHRCGESGTLSERREPAVKNRRPRRRTSRPLAPPRETKPPSDTEWREHLRGVVSLADTPGETYLAGRGIPIEAARAAQVRYHPCFLGRPAVLFPIRDRQGELVAVQGRYVDTGDPKCRTVGPKRLGLFLSTPKALQADPLVVTEAPIDALSLASQGLPAVALVGTSAPTWLAEASAFRRVVLALDADEAGDRATSELALELSKLGARPLRLRPPQGHKDWNAALMATGELLLPKAFDLCETCERPFTPDIFALDIETRCPRCRAGTDK